MTESLEGEKLRGERLRSLAHVLEAGETGCQTGQGRGKKLVTEDSKPVGSGRFRVPSQDPRGVLGISFSSLSR